MTPEEQARQKIDAALTKSGWVLRDKSAIIRDQIASSLNIEPEDFDFAPFSRRGGLGKAHQLFGAELPNLIIELNDGLAA